MPHIQLCGERNQGVWAHSDELHHVDLGAFWLMKPVFVVCSRFHGDTPHFHLLFLQPLDKYKLGTHVRARLIGKKISFGEASLRQQCKLAFFESSVLHL